MIYPFVKRFNQSPPSNLPRLLQDADLVIDPTDRASILNTSLLPAKHLEPVRRVLDRSGKGHQLTQATSGYRPLYLSHNGDTDDDYISFSDRIGYNGTPLANYLVYPHDSAVSYTGDCTHEISISGSTYNSADLQILTSKNISGVGWAVLIQNGNLYFYRSVDGSTNLEYLCPGYFTTIPDRQRVDIRIELDQNNGASGSTVTFYRKINGSFQFIAAITVANAGASYNNTASGIGFGSQGNNYAFRGKLHRYRIWADLTRTDLRLDLHPSTGVHGSSDYINQANGVAFTTTVSNTDPHRPWTVHGPCLLFDGIDDVMPYDTAWGQNEGSQVSAYATLGTSYRGLFGRTSVGPMPYSGRASLNGAPTLYWNEEHVNHPVSTQGKMAVVHYEFKRAGGSNISINGGTPVVNSGIAPSAFLDDTWSQIGGVSGQQFCGLIGRSVIYPTLTSQLRRDMVETWCAYPYGITQDTGTPIDEASLRFWFDSGFKTFFTASAGDVAETDGDAVQRWDSVNDSVSCREATNYPVLESTGPNGRKSVIFGATTKLVATATVDYLPITNNFALLLVVKPASSQATDAEIIDMEQGSSKGVGLVQDGSNLNRLTFKYGASTAKIDATEGVWQVLMWLKSGTTATLWKNGRQIGSTSVTDSIANAAATLTLGDKSGSKGFAGEIAAIVFDNATIYEPSLTEWAMNKFIGTAERELPERIPGARWWLDSRKMTKHSASALAANTETVVSWTDRIGGIAFDQGSSNGIQTADGVSFNGSTQFLKTATGIPWTHTPKFTVFLVCYIVNSHSGTAEVICGEGASSGNYRNWMFYKLDGVLRAQRYDGGTSNDVEIPFTDGWNVIVVEQSGTISRVRKHSNNGWVSLTNTIGNQTSANLISVGTLIQSGSSVIPAASTISQLWFSDAVQTTADINALGAYFCALHGLTWLDGYDPFPKAAKDTSRLAQPKLTIAYDLVVSETAVSEDAASVAEPTFSISYLPE